MTENTVPEDPRPEKAAAAEKPKSASDSSGLGCGEHTTGSSFCVAIGKCSGNTYRALIEKSDRLTKCLGGVVKSISDEANMLRLRLCNLFKTVKKDTQLTHWELKRRDDFARLGEELYRRREAELEKMESDEDFQAILARVREDEEHIRDIEDQKTVQRRRMRDATTFGHATTQLKNPDPRIRRAALRILMRLGKAEAIIKIMPLLKDSDAEVREKAREAIRTLSGEGEAPADPEHTEGQDHDQPENGTEHGAQPGNEHRDRTKEGDASGTGNKNGSHPGNRHSTGHGNGSQPPENRPGRPEEEQHDQQ